MTGGPLKCLKMRIEAGFADVDMSVLATRGENLELRDQAERGKGKRDIEGSGEL